MSVTLDEAVEAFWAAREAGEAISPETFAERYPEWKAELLELLPLLPKLSGMGATQPAKIVWADIPLPAMLGEDFRLLRRIGQGGMGTVFEAEQCALKRRVAVKVLAASLALDGAQRDHFAQEGAIIARLHHPNIVQVYSAGVEGGNCFYAMELMQGSAIDAHTARTPRAVAELGLQVAMALAYAHRCGVLHCDIKPANLLLAEDGHLLVSDFGLARLQGSAGAEAGGTLRYMAPELFAGAAPSPQSDLYALGLTLYELTVGHSPFAGLSPQETRDALAEGRIPPLRSGSQDFDALIAHCLAVAPGQRYASMDALADDLQRFLRHEPLRVHPGSPLRRLALWARRSPAVATLTGVALLCAFGCVAALVVGYCKTREALALAEANGALAEASLTQVFHDLSARAPTQKESALLAALLPYYQAIATQRQLPAERLREANQVIADAALRLGNAALAEAAWRQLRLLAPGPHTENGLASALRLGGKSEAAREISQAVATRYADSADPAERFEAVKALQALDTPEALQQAFDLVSALLQADPTQEETRFIYASVLGRDPRRFSGVRIPGVEPNAAVLLHDLAEAHPERTAYGLGLLDLSTRRLKHGALPEKDLALALSTADRLLGQHPNAPEVLASTVRFWEAVIAAYRRSGERTAAARLSDRMAGILSVLALHPEAPDVAHEALLEHLLDRRDLALQRKDAATAQRLKVSAESALEAYHGAKAETYRQRLQAEPRQ